MTAIEQAWREHWGRLLALLVARFRRLDIAEEALADAFERAARTWGDEPPANPAGWLYTTATRRALDLVRAETIHARKLPLLAVDEEGRGDDPADAPGSLADERLRLVFLLAHPTLAPEAQAALALRLVLGVPTADVAALFLVSEATMAARLTRAKKRLAAAGAAFALPDELDLPARVDAATRAAYLCFSAGYAPAQGAAVVRRDLADEGVRLARLLHELLPREAAPRALLALVLLQHSRRDARTGPDGGLVLLGDQDRTCWHRDEIEAGVALLTGLAPRTRYAWELGLQAEIAAAHATAPSAAATDWRSIADTYLELERLTDSPVVRLNRAVAVAEADGPRAGLALLADLDAALPRSHRLPAVRGELLARAGDVADAREQLRLAIERCGNEAERSHLRQRLADLDD